MGKPSGIGVVCGRVVWGVFFSGQGNLLTTSNGMWLTTSSGRTPLPPPPSNVTYGTLVFLIP